MIGTIGNKVISESLTYPKVKRHFRKNPEVPVVLRSGGRDSPNYLEARVVLTWVGREICGFRIIEVIEQGKNSLVIPGDTGKTAINDLYMN